MCTFPNTANTAKSRTLLFHDIFVDVDVNISPFHLRFSHLARTKRTAAAAAAVGHLAVYEWRRATIDDEAAETDTSKPLTAESANEALDTVRPYLQADGGDVNVVSVQSGVVLVELVGACGTCTQSAATLQLGVEGALKRAFGKQIVKVLQVAKRDSAAAAAATINDPTALAKRVDEHLDKVRGPLEKLGGSVTVSRFSLSETKLGEGGIVELSFQGPSALGMGIQQAVKEQFVREVKEVKLIQVR